MNITIHLIPIVSLLAGILILIMPRLLSTIVAIYLIRSAWSVCLDPVTFYDDVAAPRENGARLRFGRANSGQPDIRLASEAISL